MIPSRTVGIDFGTHKTLVARWDDEISRPVLVRLRPASGDDMPSVVHVDPAGRMTFGEEAERLGATDPEGCQRAFKRDLGLHAAPYLLHAHEFSARDLAREYLRWIKGVVEEESLHGSVEHAVITVPAAWLPGAKAELKQAAVEAGFTSVELLDEPVAAGLAFLHSRRDLWAEGALLVFDWGAGTLDLAVLTLADGKPQLVPDLVGGKAGLGGEDVDRHLMQAVNKRLAQLGLTKLEKRPAGEIEQIRRRAHEWKVRHETSPSVVWQMVGMSDECSTSAHVAIRQSAELRWSSEEIATRIQGKIGEAVTVCADLVERANAKGMLPAGILLVGGSSQFVALRAMLETRFPKIRLLSWDQRISAVALGAATQARVSRAKPYNSSVSLGADLSGRHLPILAIESKNEPTKSFSVDGSCVDEEQADKIRADLRSMNAFLCEGRLRLTSNSCSNLRDIVRLCRGIPLNVDVIASGWLNSHFEIISDLQDVDKLIVSSGRSLTDEALYYISRMHSLRVVDLRRMAENRITAGGLCRLAQLPRMKLLKFPCRMALMYQYGLRNKPREEANWVAVDNMIRFFRLNRPDIMLGLE